MPRSLTQADMLGRVKLAAPRAPLAWRTGILDWWVGAKARQGAPDLLAWTERWLVEHSADYPGLAAWLWQILDPQVVVPQLHNPYRQAMLRRGRPAAVLKLAQDVGALTGQSPVRVLRAAGLGWDDACSVVAGSSRRVAPRVYAALVRAWDNVAKDGAYQLPLAPSA